MRGQLGRRSIGALTILIAPIDRGAAGGWPGSFWGRPGGSKTKARANHRCDLLLGRILAPRWPRMATRCLQDAPKMGPNRLQDGSRMAQKREPEQITDVICSWAEFWLQDGPEWLQDKMPPRCSQNGSNSAPRWLQDGSKMAQKREPEQITDVICSWAK